MDKQYFIVRRMSVSDRACHRLFFESIEDIYDGLLSKSEAETRLKSKLQKSTVDLDYDEFVIYDIRFNMEIYDRLCRTELKYESLQRKFQIHK